MAIPESNVYQEFLDFKTNQTIRNFDDITQIYKDTLSRCWIVKDYWIDKGGSLYGITPSNDYIEINKVGKLYYFNKIGQRYLLIEA